MSVTGRKREESNNLYIHVHSSPPLSSSFPLLFPPLFFVLSPIPFVLLFSCSFSLSLLSLSMAVKLGTAYLFYSKAVQAYLTPGPRSTIRRISPEEHGITLVSSVHLYCKYYSMNKHKLLSSTFFVSCYSVHNKVPYSNGVTNELCLCSLCFL